MANVRQTNPNPNIAGTRNSRIYIERRRIPTNELENQIDGNPRFGVVRDRLFHAMLIRLSLPYYVNFPMLLRRFIEFFILVVAVVLLILLIYTHFLVSFFPALCLGSIKGNWPKKGIVRVEVIRNLEEFKEMQLGNENGSSNGICHFNMAEILRKGKLPAEIRRHKNIRNWEVAEIFGNQRKNEIRNRRIGRSMPIWVDAFFWLVDKFHKIQLNPDKENKVDGMNQSTGMEEEEGRNNDFEDGDDEFSSGGEESEEILELEGGIQFYQHLFEFSLYYGLLRLNAEMRNELDLETLVVQLDVEKAECLRNWRERPWMRYLVGLDELVIGSVKELSENETERGYLRDLRSGEMYHFVTFSAHSSTQYLTAFIVMLIFTFAISLLLRFSHDQIFVFIVDLFQMFEQNQPLIFPIAPLLTVILALVGMEAIMSEIFNDTSTAFYVILLVWLADQYDAIFCHSPIGRRHWLRMFYLYHFAFYAYQYRYNGIYSGLALLTSAAFTLHSMIFFFHHYELPHIIYQEQLLAAVHHLQSTEGVDGTVDIMRIRQVSIASPNGEETTNSQQGTVPPGNFLIQERSLRIALSAIFGNRLSMNITERRDEMAQNEMVNDTSNQAEERAQQEINQTPEELVANSIFDAALQEAEEQIRRDNPTEMNDVTDQ